MKSKSAPFCQYLFHEEPIEDDEKIDEYLEIALPLIGTIIMYSMALKAT